MGSVGEMGSGLQQRAALETHGGKKQVEVKGSLWCDSVAVAIHRGPPESWLSATSVSLIGNPFNWRSVKSASITSGVEAGKLV